ncbi:MAG: RIP metalloprotease RseP [Gammaproteobacteria bacterium]|jgi:regulator of sigma E protease|nr:RIP metalloprotease RseP [Chromatiales bacterium]MCP4925966.1 RIP metalloprotease RseP [Gammaproteobacteria bacterium]MDP7152965.1 RIP metalloprotease RseP [Gammaproteobacteria bacterium]MDP7419496.1 RIP metalloprotease RseP [Gammaproteobacteria bacterium]MDP7660460.1 RIP metalloprotease RseP [Gammaproteobacteria bacterium]
MDAFVTNILSFIIAIAILVAVHEWGHYIVARIAGVKVLRFSIGFGRPLWIKKYGQDQTEFCISAIPFGGYVKLLDERDCAVSLDEQERAFNRQSPPVKTAVLVAGPLLNFLFAIGAYWCMYMVGVPGLKPVIGAVEPATIAARAGVLAGDEINAVGARAVATWEGAVLEILGQLLDAGEIELQVTGQDGGERRVVMLAAGRESELTEPGQLFTGLGFSPWSPVVPAVIDKLTPGGPAERGGLLAGDEVIAADGEPISSWTEWVEFIRVRPEQTMTVTVLRDGLEHQFEIHIGVAEEGGESIGRIGTSVLIVDDLMAEMRAEQRYGVLAALSVAITKTWDMTTLTVRMLASMVTGGVSIKNISGPINIAQFAGQSASIGLVAFLSFLAIVSISLGILNLLPIPMLDGGQIAYQIVEAIKGSPISERMQIFGQQMGILFLLLLMSFAFYNDLTRIFS